METFQKNCKLCGNPFCSRGKKALFCSPQCRLAHWRSGQKKESLSLGVVVDQLREINGKLDLLLEKPQKTDPSVKDHFSIFSQKIASANTTNGLLEVEDLIAANMFLTKTQKQDLLKLITLKIKSL